VAGRGLARWWPAHPSTGSQLGQRPAIPHAAASTPRARLRRALAMVAQGSNLYARGCRQSEGESPGGRLTTGDKDPTPATRSTAPGKRRA
jgi:hypothetical protein